MTVLVISNDVKEFSPDKIPWDSIDTLLLVVGTEAAYRPLQRQLQNLCSANFIDFEALYMIPPAPFLPPELLIGCGKLYDPDVVIYGH